MPAFAGERQSARLLRIGSKPSEQADRTLARRTTISGARPCGRPKAVTAFVRSQQREAAALALGSWPLRSTGSSVFTVTLEGQGRRVLATAADPASARWVAADLVDPGQPDRVASGVRASAHRSTGACDGRMPVAPRKQFSPLLSPIPTRESDGLSDPPGRGDVRWLVVAR